MKLAWELLMDAADVFIIYDFLVRYFGYRAEGWRRYAGTLMMAGISFCSVAVISWIVPFEVLSTILDVIICSIFCICFLKGNVFEKVFISAFFMSVVILVAVTTALLFSYIRRADVYYIFAVLDPVRMAAMVTTKIVLFAAGRLIIYLRRKADLSFQEFLLLVVLLLFSFSAVAALMPIALRDAEAQERIFGAILIITGMDVMMYYLFLRISRSNQVSRDYALLQLQFDSERKNGSVIRQMYEEICAVRHDMKNHLLCIKLLAEQEKCGGILAYIQNFSEEQQRLERTFIFTGNDVLDAIVNTKLSAAEQEGIKCAARITCTELPMSQSDISVLFGNLLDNAYEAAKRAEDKRIDVSLTGQGAYIRIKVQNTVTGPVLEMNPELLTSKSDKEIHGYGTKNIQKIVRKYGGILQYQEKEDLFICDILIPLERDRFTDGESMI